MSKKGKLKKKKDKSPAMSVSERKEEKESDALVQAIKELGSGADAIQPARTLLRILDNVVQHPDVAKFRSLPHTRPSLVEKLAQHGDASRALSVLDRAGWCEIEGESSFLLLTDVDEPLLKLGIAALASLLQTANVLPSAPPALEDDVRYIPLSQLKKRVVVQAATSPIVSREARADLLEARLRGEMPGASSTQVRAGCIMNVQHTLARRAQIDAARRDHHYYRREALIASGERTSVIGLSDLEGRAHADAAVRAQFATAASSRVAAEAGQAECLAMGKEMLQRTNTFRATLGLPPLQWHQALCDIGMAHSRAMSTGKVPVGHAGADARFAAYPFPVHSAAENVAFSQGHANVPATHVDGWIASPGHLANIKAHHDCCGIAVFHNTSTDGYYSTQLFGR